MRALAYIPLVLADIPYLKRKSYVGLIECIAWDTVKTFADTQILTQTAFCIA